MKKEIEYLNNKIISYKLENKEIVCLIYRKGSKWQPLNLGQCNDGKKLTDVNQAINQAKQYIEYLNK